MPSPCEKLKNELESIQTLKQEFDSSLDTYNTKAETPEQSKQALNKAKQIRIQLDKAIEELRNKLHISPEKAKEIMGEQDVLGSEAIEKALNIKLKKEQIPKIPFKKHELERAKELNQFLVLRTPLTMEKMNELLQTEFEQQNKGKILYDTDRYKNEDFFKKDIPKLQWALTSKEPIPNSTSKNYLEQTELIADYLKNQVFKDKELPKQYEQAIEEFNKQKQNIQKLMKDDWKKAAEQLSKLKINQITRQSPAEALYDTLIYFQNNQERLLKDGYTWTKRCSSDGGLVLVGCFASDGADVDRWSPASAHDSLGVSFSRSL